MSDYWAIGQIETEGMATDHELGTCGGECPNCEDERQIMAEQDAATIPTYWSETLKKRVTVPA